MQVLEKGLLEKGHGESIREMQLHPLRQSCFEPKGCFRSEVPPHLSTRE
jgi:hypothetical protein